jgi:hypothetical protein
MTELSLLGNAEPWNRIVRHTPRRHQRLSPSEGKMTISARSIADSTNSSAIRALRWISAAVVLATIAIPGAADAKMARVARPGAYDGTWNVMFATQAGNCSSTNSVPFSVLGTRVSSAGGGKVTGGVTPNGAVSVHISVGMSAADGKGRLVGNTGTGRWNGVISGDRCSGTWQASRS